MLFQSPIISEITEYLEKIPEEKQLKILSQLKKQATATKQATTKDILELSLQINKKAFQKVKSRYI
ncbi:MAG TPA: hypothetical protein PLJ42_01675 [Chitinophagales bacterium]|jgi:hypothetical protein|nr:hypothetical protein [Chitinophagales bacterium]HQW78113.1 hypothetical protein [Chitinophagales bacterium]HRB67325.1 hypothetical protein [Chitinophagales bacterium]